MQVLNLVRPKESDIKYEIIQFPDGEPHIVLNGIDDLCDGGGTFKGIAQLLGFHYPDRERTIYVTHMVNPKVIEIV